MDFRDFQSRLVSWSRLRHRCQYLDLDQSLRAINAWWFSYPWVAYSLHWDDRARWPDPWQLLEESRLCNLARGLGIMYTLCMLERTDMLDARLIETDRDNLVLIQGKKYILNWDCDSIVNISPGIPRNPRHQLTLVQARQEIR